MLPRFLRFSVLAALVAAVSLIVAACGSDAATSTPPLPAATPKLEDELVIYSARKEELMKPVADAFQKKTGVKVLLKSDSPGNLALLIQQEGSSARGDIYFTTDAATAENLRRQNLLQGYVSPNAARIPDQFKAPDGAWTGVIGRSRNLMINTNLVTRADAPTSVFQLTDARWKGKVTMASIREGGVRLWLASLLLEKGEEATVKYVNALLANGTKVLGNHTDVRKAVGRGEFAIGLTNHYYYVFEKKDGSPVDLIYPDQGSNDIGTMVTPLTVSVIKGARHPNAARAFVDFVFTPEGQQPMTTQEAEFPLVPGVGLGDAAAPGVLPIDKIKAPRLDVEKLADAEKRVVQLFTPVLGGP